MTVVKTSELTGSALDRAVDTCEGGGGALVRDSFVDRWVVDGWAPSVNWSQGGPIIERERIEITPPVSWDDPDQDWMASNIDSSGVGRIEVGPTPLVAAMRCYVASKLGDEVNIPEELAV